MLEDAIKVEDYGTAAELKRDLDNLAARDVVDNFIQVCNFWSQMAHIYSVCR